MADPTGDTTSDERPTTGGESGTDGSGSADNLLFTAILTDEGRQNPYPVYGQLRAHGSFTSAFGMVVFTGYHDCLEALRNPSLGRPEADMPAVGLAQAARDRGEGRGHAMLFLNPPDHTRLRRLVSRAFTPRRVDGLRDSIERLLTPLVDRLAEAGTADVMAELAIPFPVAVISELLGVPESMRTREFQNLVRDSTSLIDAAATPETLEAGQRAVMELAQRFVELAGHKRKHPDDGLLSALIEVEESGDRLSEEELIANTMLLYAAGFETTSNLIGNGLVALLANPAELARLRSDRGLLPSAVWEVLRYDSPVQLNGRSALAPVDIGGFHFERGDACAILQGCANRDENVYPDAERFDVARFASGDTPPPLSFGWGIHHCLGANLARVEGEIVFGSLLDRFSEIEPAAVGSGDRDGGSAPRFRASFTLRGVESLPVTVRA